MIFFGFWMLIFYFEMSELIGSGEDGRKYLVLYKVMVLIFGFVSWYGEWEFFLRLDVCNRNFWGRI